MSISLEEALAKLGTLTTNGRIATQQELPLASEASVFAQGSVTVLYGGDLDGGVSAGTVVKNMAANDPNLRVISNAPAADFLNNAFFKDAIARSFGVPLVEVDFKGAPANLLTLEYQCSPELESQCSQILNDLESAFTA